MDRIKYYRNYFSKKEEKKKPLFFFGRKKSHLTLKLVAIIIWLKVYL